MSETEKKTGSESKPADTPPKVVPSPLLSNSLEKGGSSAAAQSSQPSKKGNGAILVLGIIVAAIAVAVTYAAWKQHKEPGWTFKKEMEKWKRERDSEGKPDTTTE